MDSAELFGRADDLERVRASLAAGRVVTLTGLGGVGKTRLARAVGARLEQTGWRVHLIDLEDVAPDTDLAPRIANAVGVAETATTDALRAVARIVGRPRTALVLDGAAGKGALRFITALLDAAPDAVILATSRVALDASAEVVLPLGPLDVPASAAEIAVASASALFVARARERGGLDEPILAPDAAAIVGICQRVGGLPLAIELAASWTRLLSPRAIARRLGSAELPLEDPARARQTSLKAVMDATLALMAPADRATFAGLAVFAGGFDQAAATALTGDPAVLSRLRSLESAALLHVRRDTDGEPVFEYPDALRVLALPAAGPRADLRRLHAGHMARTAAEAAGRLRTAGAAGAVDWYVDHDADLRAAMDWAAGQEDVDLFVDLVASQARWWRWAYRLRDGAARIRQALAMRPSPTDPRVIHVRCELAWIDYRLHGPPGLDGFTAETLAMATASGYSNLEAEAAIARATCAEPEEGARLLERAVELSEVLDDPILALSAHCDLGIERSRTGHTVEALACFEAGVRDARAAGQPWCLVTALVNLGMELVLAGRSHEAIAVLADAVSVQGPLSDAIPLHAAREFLAVARARDQQLPEAYGDLLLAIEQQPVDAADAI